jgi:DNA-binding NtrC family response regulator
VGPVLVVEDEALIREVLVMAFEDAGIGVVAAGSADEAVRLLEGGVAARALVTDLRMPGRLDGVGLAAWAAGHRPGLPVVVVSGDASAAALRASCPAAAAIVRKPYQTDEVVGVVRRLIAG